MTLAARLQSIAVVFALALSAAGCSSSTIASMPTWAGGEPGAAPARLESELQYPAVNERPPARDAKIVSEEEQAKIERELAAAREAQAKKAAQAKKDRAGMLANQPKPTAPTAGPTNQ
jgi:hypothetical protein